MSVHLDNDAFTCMGKKVVDDDAISVASNTSCSTMRSRVSRRLIPVGNHANASQAPAAVVPAPVVQAQAAPATEAVQAPSPVQASKPSTARNHVYSDPATPIVSSQSATPQNTARKERPRSPDPYADDDTISVLTSASSRAPHWNKWARTADPNLRRIPKDHPFLKSTVKLLYIGKLPFHDVSADQWISLADYNEMYQAYKSAKAAARAPYVPVVVYPHGRDVPRDLPPLKEGAANAANSNDIREKMARRLKYASEFGQMFENAELEPDTRSQHSVKTQRGKPDPAMQHDMEPDTQSQHSVKTQRGKPPVYPACKPPPPAGPPPRRVTPDDYTVVKPPPVPARIHPSCQYPDDDKKTMIVPYKAPEPEALSVAVPPAGAKVLAMKHSEQGYTRQMQIVGKTIKFEHTDEHGNTIKVTVG